MDNKNTNKEDLDIIKESGFDFKDIVKYVGEIARNYFLAEEAKV